MASGSVIGRTNVGRNTGRPAGRRFAALTMVFIMIAVVLVTPLTVLSSENTVPSQPTTYTVTYHQGSYGVDPNYNETGSNGEITVTYYGVPVSEYNPQFWSGNITGDVDSNPSDWYKILRYGENSGWFGSWEWHPKKLTVFAGWASNSNWNSGYETIDPGTDLRYLDTDNDFHIDLYATWSRANEIEAVGDYNNLDVYNYQQMESINFDDGTKYTNLVLITDYNISIKNLRDSDIGRDGSKGFTIRSEGTLRYLDTANKGCSVNLNADVIIDNVAFWTDISRDEAEDHKNDAFYAKGHQLIIGTGVTTTAGITIYGGSEEGVVAESDIRIFCGSYESIYGGSNSGNVDRSSVVIMGQNRGGSEETHTTVIRNTLYGGSDHGNPDRKEVTEILMAGGVMNNPGKNTTGYPIGDSHSNVIGGCRTSGTASETHVTITNMAEVFAVQGGGRLSDTKADETNVEVSGRAKVSYMVCGSVTDGNDSSNHVPVGTSNVLIRDEATIGDNTNAREYSEYGYGSVFGGGWDTYTLSEYRSTEDTNVEIYGGTIYGSVYGGGFRGTIGYQSEGDGDGRHYEAVDIDIYGGTIYGSVYGGGKGGKDPMALQSDRSDATGRDSDTGRAYVYGDVQIDFHAGTIYGAIFGGGEGVDAGSKSEDVSDSAKVVGDIGISTEPGSVVGDLYGGGKGTGSPDVAKVTGTISIDVSGSVKRDSGTPEYISVSQNVYGGGQNGAVYGATSVTVNGEVGTESSKGSIFGGGFGQNATVGNGNGVVAQVSVHGKVHGNVYGGGQNGAVNGGTAVEISGIVDENVYGGGQNAEVGDGADVAASVTVSGTVKGSVYGGGENGAVRGGTSIIITGTVEEDVYGGGKLGSVSKSTYVEIADGATVSGNVFGAGFGSASDAEMALVSGGSTVRVSGIVKKSVYGGGNLASVASTDIQISSAEVYGSVYGGGNGQDGIEGSAQVHGDVVIDIVDSIIGSQSSGGSVYGGGHGVSATSGDVSIAAVTGSVSVSVSGKSTVNGDVYGGGMYGTVGVSHTGASTTSASDFIEISLIGGDVRITGSVYGGGLGESKRTATNVGQRTITINGPSIDGSVYGGSRYGDDNYGNVSGLSHGDVLILIASGNIASGSSGNVYGGGYIGHSDLSSEIRIGSATEMSPVVDHLRIKSVFGGPSVGEPSDDGGQIVLMEGDARITISNGFGSAYSDFSITGDIFGEGDYCAIRGQAMVWIEDFRQDADMLSIQKADELRIIGSEIVLDGNMDGSTTQASSKLSLNLIGNLVLQKSSERATKITLNAAASQISGYSSYDYNPTPGYGDGVGNVPDFSATDVTMNTIVVNEGMILSILGIGDNAISADGVIQGYTLMESDARGYYGALAAGVTDNVMVGSTGFYVFTERGMVLGEDVPTMAQTADYVYSQTIDGKDYDIGMTMWFLSGVYKVDSTVILQDVEDASTIYDNLTVKVPKTVTGSEIWFVGGYVVQDHSGSLELVDGVDKIDNAGKQFVLTVGTDGGNVQFQNGQVTAFPAETAKSGDGVVLGMRLETKAGFTTSGYAGSVVLHMVEMLGNIPINSFDVEIDLYLRVVSENIVQTIVMRPRGDGYYGTTDVYLPVLPNNATGLYYIANGSYTDSVWTGGSYDGDLSLNTVGTNLNKNGWLTSNYPEDALTQFSTSAPGDYLGIGGVFAPVLYIQYETDAETFEDMVFTVTIQDEVTGALKKYTVTLQPELAHMVYVQFYDKYLVVDDDSLEWSGFKEILTVPLVFGTSLSNVYVAVKSWNNVDAASIVERFSANIGDYLEVDKGSLVTAGSTYELRTILVNKYGEETALRYSLLTVEQFLELYNERKNNVMYPDGPAEGFDYSANDEWYDSQSCLSRFFFSSVISADTVSVYAGYTIQVEVIPFYVDDTGDVVTTDLFVSPSVVLQGNPGDQIDLTELIDGLTWTAGFELYDGDAVWYYGADVNNPIASGSDGHVTIAPRADYAVYLRLQVAEYTVSVKVQTDDGEPEDVAFTMTVNGTQVDDASGRYKEPVTVSVSSAEYTEYAGYHVNSVTGSTINGQVPSADFTYKTTESSFDVSFDMPNGDTTVVIHLTNKYNVRVELPLTSGSDNSRFSVSLSESGDSISIGLSAVAGSRSDSILVSGGSLVFGDGTGTGIGGGDFTVRVFDSEGKEVSSGHDLGRLGSDVTFYAYVTMEWTLTFDDSGYTIDRFASDPVSGDTATESKSIETSGSERVHTGDLLVLVPKSNHSVDAVTATGAVADRDTEHGYIVSGGMNVRFSEASAEWTLKVSVSFYANEAQIDPGVSGSVTVTGPSGTVTSSDYTQNDRNLVFTFDLAEGQYTVEADFAGYTQSSGSIVDLGSNTTVEVRMDLVDDEFDLTITVSFPAGVVGSSLVDKSGLTLDEASIDASEDGNNLVYTAQVKYGSHTISGSFPGFSLDVEMPYTFDVREDMTITLKATAVEMTIVFHDGTDNGVTASWTVTDSRTVSQIYRGNGGTVTPAGWVHQGGIVRNDSALALDMFVEGELELSIVPAIEDVEDVEPKVRTLVLLRTQIDGYTYEVPFLQDGFEIVSYELGITATFEDGKVTFHTQNGGTGSFSILFRGDSSALLLVVYVLEPVNSL